VPDINRPMARSDEPGLDERRFRLLFDSHRRTVLGYALRRLDDPEDAADVAAETFLVAWRRLDDVPAGDDARPWLLGVARRVLANQRRGARVGLADRLRGELAGRAVALDAPTGTDLAVRRALAAEAEAVAAMRTFRRWPILREMQSGGDFPRVVWQFADAMAGRGRVPAGRPMTVEEGYRSSLGC
jgi:DNA-directed RNA polymerase specialized sigma24 family protein